MGCIPSQPKSNASIQSNPTPDATLSFEQFVDDVLAITWSEGDMLQNTLVDLSPLIHGSDYVLLLFALTILHVMIRDGATDNVLSRLSQLDSLGLYNVYSSSEGPNTPANLRNYARYLDCLVRAYRDLGKLEMTRIWSGRGPSSTLSSEIDKGDEFILQAVTRRLLSTTKAVQEMIDALVECRNFGGKERCVTKALSMIVRDLVALFQFGSELIIGLLGRCFTLRQDAAAVLQICRNFCEQTAGVTDYLKTAKQLPALRAIEIPTFRQVPLSLVDQLEAWLSDSCIEQNRASTSTSQAVAPQASPHGRVLHCLTQILRTPERSKAMRELKDEQAQLVIDYLYSVLVQPEFVPLSFRKHTIIALYKLSKSSQLYPQHYVLQDVSIETVEDGGGFCDIYRGRHQDQDLCLKVVRLFQKQDTDAILKVFAKEAILWGQLIHPNILPFYGVSYTDKARRRICLASPWMKNGNIVKYLGRNPSIPRMPLIYDIVSGLGYLHSENIIHGDLKGVNVLITDSGRACLCDFGMSSVLTDRTLGYTVSNTSPTGASYRWSAPELLQDNVSMLSYASDIWAFGCVCYQVLTRRAPFHELSSDGQVIGKIIRGGLPSRPVGGNSASKLDQIKDGMWDLMTHCWETDPEFRPTCQQIIRNFRLEESVAEHGGKIRKVSDNVRFLDAMRKKTGVLIDLAQIEQILKAL